MEAANEQPIFHRRLHQHPALQPLILALVGQLLLNLSSYTVHDFRLSKLTMEQKKLTCLGHTQATLYARCTRGLHMVAQGLQRDFRRHRPSLPITTAQPRIYCKPTNAFWGRCHLPVRPWAKTLHNVDRSAPATWQSPLDLRAFGIPCRSNSRFWDLCATSKEDSLSWWCKLPKQPGPLELSLAARRAHPGGRCWFRAWGWELRWRCCWGCWHGGGLVMRCACWNLLELKPIHIIHEACHHPTSYAQNPKALAQPDFGSNMKN